jgi:hypothetical protein
MKQVEKSHADVAFKHGLINCIDTKAKCRHLKKMTCKGLLRSVPDPEPDPNPPDPHVFGPPGSGSGSTGQRYESGSGSFYHHAKIVRKTLIPYIFLLFLTFYL